MKLTTTQITDFQQALVSDLESQVWDFIKTYASELSEEDAFIDEYEALRDQLLDAGKGITISFK